MPILRYRGATPKISKDCFVAETATIVGDISIGEGSSVWFGASLRSEMVPIRIGARTNIQDNSSVHADAGYPSSIGDDVSIGHGAIVHGAVIGSNCLIGMGCILLNGCKIGNNCILGAGTLILQEAEFPDNSLILGSPGKVKRELTQDEIDGIALNAKHYYDYRAEYLEITKRV